MTRRGAGSGVEWDEWFLKVLKAKISAGHRVSKTRFYRDW